MSQDQRFEWVHLTGEGNIADMEVAMTLFCNCLYWGED